MPLPLSNVNNIINFQHALCASLHTITNAFPFDISTSVVFSHLFTLSFVAVLGLQGHDFTCDLIFQHDMHYFYLHLTSCTSGSPAACIHNWKFKICHAHLFKIDDIPVHTVLEVL